MRARNNRLWRDERGMSFVYVGMGFMGFLAASTLAIDVGMFMTGRSQAQNSADAGALAGATALLQNSFDDRSPGGPAVQSAINTSLANKVIAGDVSVQPPDVTFPNDPSGQPTRVRVQVYRTAQRGNAIPTLMGSLFGVQTVNITAVATAEASPANAETCVLPFTIPDKWTENQTGPWDPNDTFDMYDKKGKLLDPPDKYVPPGEDGYTGYNAMTDKGTELVLKANNSSNVTASWYNPWDLPGSVGASDYRDNIDGCNPAVIPMPFDAVPETGNMVGPTSQGMQDLIDKDPTASWDFSTNSVHHSTEYPTHSPREVVIPVYDPVVFADGQQHGKGIQLHFVNFIGFFIEPMKGGQVYGRITPAIGVFDRNAGPAPKGAFPKVIRLVQ